MTETMRWNTHYDVLEVVEHASQEVIRGAYKHLQQKWHPDRNPALHATDQARRINAAYEVLSDPVLREQYDEQLKNGRVRAAAPKRQAGPLSRREWIVGGVFFLSLASFATNGISSPAAAPTASTASRPALTRVADYRPSERVERQRRRSDLLNRLILDADRASAREQALDNARERARQKAVSQESSAWWRDAALLADGDFKLTYAGEIEGAPGVSLLFSSVPSVRSLNRSVTVLTADGKPAPGRWRLGKKNPQIARFGNLGPGRYIVVVKPNLVDESGQTLGLRLKGPITIEECARPGRHDVQQVARL